MVFSGLVLSLLAISATASNSSERKVHRRSNSKSFVLARKNVASSLKERASTASTSTWLNLGCRQDGSARLLANQIASSNSMTADICIAQCAAAGYIFAGVEYGIQCHCGNSLNSALGGLLPSSDCNMACGGNSAQSCGSSWVMNLYSTPVAHIGCYADSSSRLLPGPSEDSNTMSPQACVTFCSSYGYGFAGVENGNSCYCGKTLSATPISGSSCSMACNGDSSAFCGNSWVLDIYTAALPTLTHLGCYADSATRLLPNAFNSWSTVTPTACASFCFALGYSISGVEYGNQCYCGTGVGTATPLSSSSCNMPCGGDSSVTCGSSWIIDVYSYGANVGSVTNPTMTTSTTNPSPSPTATTSSNGLTHVGCFADSSTRILAAAENYFYNLTPLSCATWCYSMGYTYSGVEYGTQCYCGTGVGSASTIAASNCNMACGGDSSQTCGSSWVIDVYKYSGGKTTTATTTTPTTTSTTTAAASTQTGLIHVGCFADSSTRILAAAENYFYNLTPLSCATWCYSMGFTYSGVEYGTQCYCGTGVGTASTIAASNCNMACGGDASQTCGSSWVIDVYKYIPGTSTTTKTSTTTMAATPTTATSTTTGNALSATSNAAATLITSTVAPASATNTKKLYAHYIIGNTNGYQVSDWKAQISLAQGAGIDGFALNFGDAQYEYDSMTNAYAAAAGTGFTMFLSIDFTAFSCNDPSNTINRINQYKNQSAQAMYKGVPIVSTFSGDSCTFGQGSVTAGWNYIRAQVGSMYLIPAIFASTSSFSSMPWFDAELNWNSGWPMAGIDLTTASDLQYISALSGRGYVPAISPAFFTYYGPNSYNKDWIYRSDDWLLAQRFEMLIGMRNQFDMAEIVSWNDFGESHYIGPLVAANLQPMSTGWTNGMPHTAWLSLIAYYAPALKTGVYPTPTDGLWLWTRPHPRYATPTAPTLAQPSGVAYTDDKLYAVVILASPAIVTITSGTNFVTYNLNTGVNKISLASAAGAITAKIVRNGQIIKSLDSTGSFSYNLTPPDYNYNYYVQSA